MLSPVSIDFMWIYCVMDTRIAALLGLLDGNKHKNFWECSGENLDQFWEWICSWAFLCASVSSEFRDSSVRLNLVCVTLMLESLAIISMSVLTQTNKCAKRKEKEKQKGKNKAVKVY